MNEILRISPFDLIFTKEQEARHNTQEFLILVENIRVHNIIQPISVRLPFTVVAGGGRTLAARKLNLPWVPCIAIDGDPEDDGFKMASENNARAAFTSLERVDLAKDAKERFPEMLQKDMAYRLGERPEDLSRMLKIAICTIAYTALKEGQIKSIAAAYSVAQALPDAKQGLLALIQNGATTHDVQKAGMRTRKPAEDKAEKSSRIVHPLQAGLKLTVSGGNLTIEKYIEALSTALDAAKRAHRDHIGIAAAMKCWSDRAKAGA